MDQSFAALVERWHIGNVILFARNLVDGEQAKALTERLQQLVADATGVPAFIAADQEGGIVLRLTKGATAFPGNMAVGATGDPAYAELVAQAIGTELLTLGINMNLAPVLDINNNPRNPVIGVRSFGATAATVTAFGRAAVRGYRRAGIACVAKHFPGHGDTELDSHTSLPAINRSVDELLARELVPFQAAVDEGIDAIMTAHILFPQLDAVPATLSRRILTELLRERMGFRGLILTDSMRMAGITQGHKPGEAAVAALAAGCDVLLYSAMGEVEEEAVKAVHEAVRRGILSEERIYASARRIVEAKRRLAAAPVAPDPEAHRQLALEVSRAAVTLVRDTAHLVPLPSGQPTVIEVTRRAITQVEDHLATVGVRAQLHTFWPRAQYLTVGTDPDAAAVADLCERITGDVIVLITQDAWRYPGQQELMRTLAQRYPGKIVLVAGRLPYDVELVPEIPAALCTYDLVPTSVQALFEVLSGALAARGSWPK